MTDSIRRLLRFVGGLLGSSWLRLKKKTTSASVLVIYVELQLRSLTKRRADVV
jgi:hypothetical protein